MAQLRDLLVNGASRFLGVVNFNNEAIFNEGVTLNETLTLLKNTDANGTAYNSPALVIGNKTAGHLEFDGNEIMSKASETTTASLHLNHDGGQVVIGPGGMSTTGVVTVGSGNAATSSTAGELIVNGGIAVSKASIFGNKITSDTLTLTNTSAASHITFSRGNFNYITAPTNGVIAFVVNGQAVGDVNSEFIIKDGEIRPGTTNVTTLGASSYRWSTIYGVNLNLSGNATIGDATTDAHTIKGKVTLTGEFIPGTSATYSLGDSSHYWKKLYVGDGTEASSTTTGSVIISGGLGVANSGYFGGNLTAKTLTITDTNAVEHIKFNRSNVNYITTPSGGKFAFVVNGEGAGASADADLVIMDGAVYPGTTEVTSLGQSGTRWTTVYSKDINATGNLTLGSGTSNAHTIKGTITLTGNLIPGGTSATYTLGNGDHYWKKLYVGDGTDATSTATGSIIVSGGIGVSKSIVVGDKINLIRKNGNNYGRISFYDPSYYTWFEYMSNPVDGAAPTTGKPVAYGDVTSWARRSLIESSSGYGWIWEAASNAKASATSTATTPLMALSSNNGNLRIKGDMTVDGGDVKLGDGTYYINTSTSKLNALTTVGLITAGSHIVPDKTQENDLGSTSVKWRTIYVGNGSEGSAVNTGNVQIDGGLSASKKSYFDAQVVIKKAVMEYDTSDECLYFSFN